MASKRGGDRAVLQTQHYCINVCCARSFFRNHLSTLGQDALVRRNTVDLAVASARDLHKLDDNNTVDMGAGGLPGDCFIG